MAHAENRALHVPAQRQSGFVRWRGLSVWAWSQRNSDGDHWTRLIAAPCFCRNASCLSRRDVFLPEGFR